MPYIFPQDVLDEICDLVGSASGGFPTYSNTSKAMRFLYELVNGLMSIKWMICAEGWMADLQIFVLFNTICGLKNSLNSSGL